MFVSPTNKPSHSALEQHVMDIDHYIRLNQRASMMLPDKIRGSSIFGQSMLTSKLGGQ